MESDLLADALPRRQQALFDSEVKSALGHSPVGGPLTAGHGDHTARGDVDVVFTRELGGTGLIACDQGAQTGKDAEYIGAFNGTCSIGFDPWRVLDQMPHKEKSEDADRQVNVEDPAP
jgi:hypothetical protein